MKNENKTTIEKKEYIPPTLEVIFLEMEEGIASASAQAITGGTNATPQVEDWVEKKDEENWDF